MARKKVKKKVKKTKKVGRPREPTLRNRSKRLRKRHFTAVKQRQ